MEKGVGESRRGSEERSCRKREMESKGRSSPCASPEFEFWMVRNPSFPQPHILSADELFVNGVLLPLHLINKPHPTPCIPDATATTTATSAAKRWKQIFRRKKPKEKEKGSAELNINIWPFSRSRSAGSRPKVTGPSGRKAHSAPCSRSNSASGRKWASSPGVHVGRSSPVWQVRRSPKSRVLNLNVPTPMCMGYGYKHHFSCRSHAINPNPLPRRKLFNLRTLFSKKTAVPSH